MKKERIIYFDYLRVFAILAVIVLHTATQNWSDLDGRSFAWNVFNIFNSAVRWGVPAFVMISGSLFLSRQVTVKQLYFKYILRLAAAYLVWSAFYAFSSQAISLAIRDDFVFSKKALLSDLIHGCYHMWFLPMIIGLYMCIPFLRQIVKDRTAAVHFLILSFVFAFLIPQAVNMSNEFIGGLFTEVVQMLNGVVSNMHMQAVMGYAFYFILGYWLADVSFDRKQRTVIYALGVAGFLSTVLLNGVLAWKTHAPGETYYGNFNVNIVLEAVAVYVWFRSRNYPSQKWNAVISQLSKYSFGAYLVHIFVLDCFQILGLHTLKFQPVLSVPIISAIAAAVSFAASCVLHKIPIVNKWLV